MDASGGNLVADPLFVDYTPRNLQLQAASPGVDAGLPDWAFPHDIRRVSRPQGAGVDIGAYER